MNQRFLFTVLLAISSAPALLAHPGHDMMEHGPAHALTSPYHLLILSATGLCLIVCGQFARKAWGRQTLRLAGAAALAASAALWTLS